MRYFKHFNVVIVVICLFLQTNSVLAQTSKLTTGREAGFMGLMEWGADLGYQTYKEKYEYTGDIYSTQRKFGPVLSAHFQTALLSNYFWSMNQDKRFKFGFIEKVDFGVALLKRTNETNSTYVEVKEDITKPQVSFIIEQGFGTVLRINQQTDVGLSYYFYSISSFHEETFGESGYFKFRFRHQRLMAELSAFGRKQIDIKYLYKGSEDRSETKFISLSYTGWNTEGPDSGSGVKSVRAGKVFFTLGKIF